MASALAAAPQHPPEDWACEAVPQQGLAAVEVAGSTAAAGAGLPQQALCWTGASAVTGVVVMCSPLGGRPLRDAVNYWCRTVSTILESA